MYWKIKLMQVGSVGIDLVKGVFDVHGIIEAGKSARVRPSEPSAQTLEFIATQLSCLKGVVACYGAYHCVRELPLFGRTVRLMAPKIVNVCL